MKNRCINLYRYLALCAILSFNISHDAVAMNRQDTRPAYARAGFSSPEEHSRYRVWVREQSQYNRARLGIIDKTFIGMDDQDIENRLNFLEKRGQFIPNAGAVVE